MRVIVFSLNGCPAGWLGAYGNDWVGTPHLDRLAAEGVVFDRHIADAPGSRLEPNSPTPFPGREGGEFAIADTVSNPARGKFGASAPPSLPGKGVGGLGSAGAGGLGCPSILVRANHPDTDAPDSYYAGWGEVFDARPQPDDTSPLDHLLRAFPALLDRLADVPDYLLWIETDRLIPPWDVQQDVFEAYLDDGDEDEVHEGDEEEEGEEDEDEVADDELGEGETAEEEFVEVVEEDEPEEAEPVPAAEPVPPWADPPTGPFDRADLDAWDYLQRTFAAVVTKLDAELGVLFDQLRARSLDQSAAWLVTSNHGFPLGEHGQLGLHRPWLHEELVHLPLLLRLPGEEQAGRRVPGFTQPPDLRATVRALLGAPPDGDGFDLLPVARGEAESARAFAISALELNGAAERAIRTADWALLVPTHAPDGDPPREPLLYEKPDDRWEVNDLRARNLERADELEAQLRSAHEAAS